MSRNFSHALFLSAAALVISGCATGAGSSKPVSTSSIPYTMAPLDSARITLKSGAIVDVPVSQEGLAEVGGAQKPVRGIPVEDFRAMLERAHPGARDIEIVEFRTNRVTVLGEVFHQIHTDLTDGPMRVMDAIAAANGFTPLANKRRVRLVRQNAGSVEVYELDLRDLMRGNHLDQNLLLEPGDVITVPRNFL